MIRRPPRSTQSRSSAASDVYKRQLYYKESSGICRWDFFDWGKQMETVMRTAHPNSVVMMMGTNDTQSVWDDGTWISYGTSKWKTAYEKRVSDMMETMLEGGARRVYWVGMPMMRESWRNSRMKLINKIIPVSYTHLRAHETRHDLVCRLLLEKKK